MKMIKRMTVDPEALDHEMNAALRPGLHRPMQPGSLDHSVSTGRDQAALTGIFFSAFCASALFGNVTFTTPFLKGGLDLVLVDATWQLKGAMKGAVAAFIEPQLAPTPRHGPQQGGARRYVSSAQEMPNCDAPSAR